jgi:magnesium transporter
MARHRKPPKHSPRYKRKFDRRTFPGSAPGMLVDDPNRPKTKMHAFVYSESKVQEYDPATADDIKPLLTPGNVLWLDIESVGNAKLIEAIGSVFGLHHLALEDVVHLHQRSKVEEYDGYIYIVARMHTPAETLATEQVSIFLGPGWVITFQDIPGDYFGPVRQRLREGKGRIRQYGADYLAYSLIDAIIDGYFPVLESYGERIDAVEERLEENALRSPLRELHSVRRDLREFRRIMWPHRETINALLRGGVQFIKPETQVFLRDCYDHTVQLIDVAETLRESCTDLRDLHLSELSQHTNDVTKVLTIIATLFLPMSFIASVYGMNFDPDVSPWNMPELRWYFGYPFSLFLMAALDIGLLVFLWRRGWLRRKE